MKSLTILVFIILNGITSLLAQPIERVLINDVEISYSQETILQCYTDDVIKIITSKKANSKYKCTLNGKLLNINNNSVVLSKLEKGNYILKIFNIGNNEESYKPVKFKLTIKESTNSLINWLTILLFIIVIALILLLVFSKKNTPTIENLNEEDTKALEQSYNNLKSTLKNQTEYNKKLKEDIRTLKVQIEQLEEANVHLIEQKEKLLKQKAKLELLNKQKDELFAMTVHDIKNPASAIKGLLELLNDYELNANEQKEIMDSLITSSENILKLTQKISETISKTDNEEFLKKEKSSIKDIIDSVVKVNTAYAKKKGIKIYNKSSSSLPEISFDKDKIEEAIDNLLNNAIKYSKPETEVIVSSYFSEHYISVEISDQGPGLTAEDQKNAFKKGVKLTPKPTGDETSSGLGLWIVKNIIEEHDGRVWVKSKIGVGSKFGFDLPRK